MSIKKSIQRSWHSLVRFISSAFLTPLKQEIIKSGGKLLEEAAQAAVSAAAASGLSNEEKFKLAYNTAIKIITSKGIDYTLTGVQGAVLAAYAQYKASK